MYGAYYLAEYDRKPPRNCYLTQRVFVVDITQNEEGCSNLLRMNVECFQMFVFVFRGTGRLKDTVHCIVEDWSNLQCSCMKYQCQEP